MRSARPASALSCKEFSSCLDFFVLTLNFVPGLTALLYLHYARFGGGGCSVGFAEVKSEEGRVKNGLPLTIQTFNDATLTGR